MCGIAGTINFTGTRTMDDLSKDVCRMTAQLKHRGPDDGGVWCDKACGVALGHRRLSIIDLTQQGHQPMHSGCQRYVIVFNGEIYNFRSIRQLLEKRGLTFRGHSDTEVLLAAIAEFGIDSALKQSNGMFAFALWDKAKRTLTLARDRLGEKPLYYGFADGAFLFGSELKAICASSRFTPRIDRRSLALYLRHNYIPAPYSIYEGVRKLLPGTFLEIGYDQPNRTAIPVPYWSLKSVVASALSDPYRGSDRDAVEELEGLLRNAVELRMEADVPLGAFLSGGIDSSTVVALMQSMSDRPVRTFTIGYSEQDFNEAAYARKVAKHIGTAHTELEISPREAMQVIPDLPTFYDEPFSDSSQIPTYLVSRLAREQVTVSLSGDGGDELFYGYSRYPLSQQIWRAIRAVPRPLRPMVSSVLASGPAWLVEALRNLLRQAPALVGSRGPSKGYARRVAEIISARNRRELYQRLISHCKNPSSVVLDSSEPLTPLTDPNGWPPCDDFDLEMMFFDTMMYLPDDILVKLDRASMAVSLESRVPLLDHNVVEFSWRLPMTLKRRGGVNKWILRQVLYKYVPPELIERPKMGFGVPIGNWMCGPLRDWAEDLLAEGSLRRQGYFDTSIIRGLWTQHISGISNHAYYLWDVLMFQSWLAAQ